MEDLFLKDEMEFLVQPEHFQSVLGFIGILYSIGLIVALCDIFLNPNFGVYRLMIVGLTFCFLITIVNLAMASTVLWRAVTRQTPNEKTVRTGEYEYDWEMLVDNQRVAGAIIGFGAVLSVIFIFLTMMRSLGRSILCYLLFISNLGVTFYKYARDSIVKKNGK